MEILKSNRDRRSRPIKAPKALNEGEKGKARRRTRRVHPP